MPRARDADVVLVVDDQPRTAELLARKAPELVLLAPGEDGARHARTWGDVERALARPRSDPDAVVLDLRFEPPEEDHLPDLPPHAETPAGRRDRRERLDKQG